MTGSNRAIILLGSNIEPRLHYLEEAALNISRNAGHIADSSKIYESDAVGFESDDKFLNQVIEVNTNLEPLDLLEQCLSTENVLGRVRDMNSTVMASRTIDIDILFYNDQIINSKSLIIPHPRLHERKFTLIPLCDLEHEIIHPILKTNSAEMLKVCKDKSDINVYVAN